MVLTTKHTKKSQRTQRLVLVNHPDSYVTLHNSGNKFSFPFYEYPLPNLPPWGKELKVRLFSLGGNGKVGYIEYNESN